MVRQIKTNKFGIVTVRNVMLDLDGTNLEEGIEIKGDEINLIEIIGYYDVDELKIEEIEILIEDNF